MLQTNNTGMCLQCLSHARHAPEHGAHLSGSTFLHWELSEVSPRLHAPPRSELLRLGSQALGWACVLCPSQVRAAQVFGEPGRCDLSPFPGARFSGCTAGAPCQADGDCPGPQEVLLAKKPACSLVGKVSPELRLPPSSPYGSGCLSPDGDGLQLALFCTWSWWCLMLELFAW